MLSHHRAHLLLLTMLWQVSSWLSPMHLAQQMDAVAHLVVHAQDVDHHHHADQTLHVEVDDGEPSHEHAQQALQLPELFAMTGFAVNPPWAAIRVANVPLAPPLLFLDGLLRPPRTAKPFA